jgi:DNA-binding transcriptional MerR regulator
VRALIGQLRVDKGWTIDEIRDQLTKMGQGHISRSALGRHVRSLADVGAELKEAQIYAEALAKEAGSADGSKLADMNAQLLQTNMFKATGFSWGQRTPRISPTHCAPSRSPARRSWT